MQLQDAIITKINSVFTVSRERSVTGKIDGRKDQGISFCLDGQITYVQDGKTYVSAPGYAVYLPKDAHYTSQTDRSGHFPLINFQSTHPLGDSIEIIPLSNQDPYIAQYENLKRTALLPNSNLRLMEQFYGILAMLYGEINTKSTVLSPAMDYLEANLHDPRLSNDLLAKQLGFSEVHFRKQFTKHYGEPPHRYILKLRIRRARQLLADGNLSVSAVAEQCGFSSVYHFSRAFKQWIGISPSEYAIQNRQTKL